MTLIEIRTENRQSVMNVTHTDNTRNRDELKNMKPKVNLTQNNYRFFLTMTGPSRCEIFIAMPECKMAPLKSEISLIKINKTLAPSYSRAWQ